MTAHSFPHRRLLLSACVALASLTIFLGIYAKAAQQSRALQREMAGIQVFGMDGSGSQLARHPIRFQKNPDAMTLGL